METRLAYMTAGSRDEAGRIGRELVASGLAACINIIDNMQSIYRWEGEIQADQEVVMIAKTTDIRLPELVEKVKSMHSYDCPCILGLTIKGGSDDFMAWIADEVGRTDLL